MQTLRNNIMLVGNMGSAPIITNFENGGKVARFRLATDNKGSKGTKQPDWHSVFAWGNMAGFLENYGAKGKQLAIHGRIVDRTYTNKSGEPRKITEIEVKHVIGL
jgi:single-strand DNA-binding protein